MKTVLIVNKNYNLCLTVYFPQQVPTKKFILMLSFVGHSYNRNKHFGLVREKLDLKIGQARLH